MKRSLFCILFVIMASCSYRSQDCLTHIETLKETKTFWEWESHKIHYIEKGSGDRHIVLLHGFGSSVATWSAQIDFLSQEGFHVWAIDFLGFGFSDKPLHVHYSPDLYCQQIEQFLSAKKIDKIHIVGNSMGGAIALAFAGAYPEKVSSMALLDPLAYPISLPLPYAIAKKLGKLAIPFFTKSAVMRTLKTIYYDATKISEELIETYFLPYQMEGGKEVPLLILRLFDDTLLHALQKSYTNIQTPVLLIWGSEDSWIPITHMSRLASDLPHTEQKTIPLCGHTPQEEKPEEVNLLLKAFLQ